MYHISEDIRARKSADRICDALMTCAKKKPFAEITVSDLNKKCGISRSTFYRLFDNLLDVLEYQCDKMGKEILLNVRGNTQKEFIINAITALEKEQDLIRLLSQSGHMDIFQRKQEEYFPLSKLAAGIELGSEYEFFHRILAQLIPMTADIWVSNGQTDSPEELYEKIHQSINMLGKWFAE